jgi:hypothetical protein
MRSLINKSIHATIILVLVLLTSVSYGQTEDDIRTITTSVPFLLISPDATSGGMGDVGVASIPNANSMHFNAAKFAFIDQNIGFTISYSPWLQGLVNDINLNYIAGYKRLSETQTIAFSLRYFTMGSIQFTNEIGENIGEFKPNEFAVDAAYALKLGDNISGAVSVRYIYSNLTGGAFAGGAETKPGMTVAGDVSVYYQKEIDLGDYDAEFAFGGNISNIGGKISYTEDIVRDFIPINLKFGPRITLYFDDYNTLSFMADINKLMVPTPQLDGTIPDVGAMQAIFSSFGDAPDGFSEELREFNISAGVEYMYENLLALRGGYFFEPNYKGGRRYFTTGLGFRLKENYGLDLAYLIPTMSGSPLANTWRLSFVFDLKGRLSNSPSDDITREE